jgi:ribosomal 50S subunit-associated protein YjgA (DUF615 family)
VIERTREEATEAQRAKEEITMLKRHLLEQVPLPERRRQAGPGTEFPEQAFRRPL